MYDRYRKTKKRKETARGDFTNVAESIYRIVRAK